MMKMKILLVVITFILSGCSISPSQPLRISTNLWIGYSPLFYIQQKGWLENSNIELINVVSLSESMQMYDSGFVDAFTGTQYEFKQMQKRVPSLQPTILLDRSHGGDVVMSNLDIEQLKNAQKIDVYLEVDSVNSILLERFIAIHGIKRSVLNMINKDPDASSMLPMQSDATLIITYTPYDVSLNDIGYKTVESTKNMHLLVLDALYADEEILEAYEDELAILNSLIAKALDHLKKDPKEYLSVIRPYFKYPDEKTFLNALKSIQWIYADRSSSLMNQFSSQNIPTEKLLEPVK